MSSKSQSGFTLVELLVVIVLIGIVGSMFYNFFNVNLGSYLRLQKDASDSASIASQSQRVASVVRGTTGISSAAGNDLVLYSYFYPSDQYVSLVHYYLGSNNKVLFCDVTPMSSNPPIGTPLTGKLKTYKIADNFYVPTGSSLFGYIDASQTALALPITDLNAIKQIRVNLITQDASGAPQDLGLQVALRNRKTNL